MRKTTIAFLLIVMSSSFCFAHTPPTAVKHTFDQKFPEAAKVKWEKENKTFWEADFYLKENKMSSNFSENGMWVKTKSPIQVADLPKAVSEGITKQYPKWKITEADRIETDKKGVIFKADLKSGKNKKGVTFKEDGIEVKK